MSDILNESLNGTPVEPANQPPAQSAPSGRWAMPVIFAAFANPDGDPGLARLQLDQEAQRVYSALKPGEEAGGWQFLNGARTTRAELIDSFTSNRVVVFHYGGHSNSQGIWLPAEAPGNQLMNGQLLEQYLESLHSLQLAFFNSCENHAWAQKLAARLPYVIATVTPVQDDAAVTFSSTFYGELAKEENTAEDAFHTASNAVLAAHQDLFAGYIAQHGNQPPPMRSTDELTDDAPAAESIFPWVGYKNPASPAWRLADAAADPLVGMPPLEPGSYVLNDRPYVTIKGHAPSDAAIFFGRNSEIRSLFDWALSLDVAQPVRLFYGQSGVGKSSLLNAGLLPRLGKRCTVVMRRRNQSLVDDFHQAIAEVLGHTPPANADAAWWNACAAEWLALTKPSLIMLDQLEEAITHFVPPKDGDTAVRYKTPLAEIQEFVYRVKEIFAQRPEGSQARLLLSFRKEYLAEIRGCFANGQADDSPDLVDHFWLDRLGLDAIVQAITGAAISRLTRDKFKISFPEGDILPKQIAGQLLDGNSPIATVLEIILNQMWDKATIDASGARVYDVALYNSLDGRNNPLQDFFDQQTTAINARTLGADLSKGLELSLLYDHTSEYGTSLPASRSALEKKYAGKFDLTAVLRSNEELYLLVDPAAKSDSAPGAQSGNAPSAADVAAPATDDSVTSLAHDTLAHVVRHEFLHSTLPGPRARRILESRTQEWMESKKGALLDSADLRMVSRGLPHMRELNEDEKKLLKASRDSHRDAVLRSIVFLLILPVLAIGSIAIYVTSVIQKELNAIHLATSDTTDGDEINAIAESLEAVRIQQGNSWWLKLIPTKELHSNNKEIVTILEGALVFSEVYRATLPTQTRLQAEFLGACATALTADNHPLLNSKNGTLNFAGTPLSADMAGNNTTCDPASHTIVLRDTATGSLTRWRDGKQLSVPASLRVPIQDPIALKSGGSVLAYGADTSLYLADLDTGQIVQVPNRSAAGGMRFSPSGRYLLEPGMTAIDLSSLQSAASVSFAPGNQGFSTTLVNGEDVVTVFGTNFLVVHRIADNAQFNYLPANPTDFDQAVYFKDKNILDAATSPNGQIVVSDSTGNRIDLWALPSSLQPLPASWSSVDNWLIKRLRRDNNMTSFPLHLTKFTLAGTNDDMHAFSPDSKLLVTLQFSQFIDSPYPHTQDTTTTLHMWSVTPPTQAEVNQLRDPIPLADFGCHRIGNFIADMVANPNMLANPGKIDYPKLQKACRAWKLKMNRAARAKRDEANADSPAPQANPGPVRQERNDGRRKRGRKAARARS